MNRADDARVWIVTGALGSMLLAVALVPLRTVVAASNLAFVFMAFTIIVAELGGRGAALATALIAAMSLNFFLTEPYLTLTISKTDDVIAFFALAACGLIAAAFGRRRERLSDVAGRADRELSTLARFAERSRSGRPLDGLLQDLRAEFALAGLVLRDESGRVLAAVPADAGARPAPRMALDGATLFAAGDEKTLAMATCVVAGVFAARSDRAVRIPALFLSAAVVGAWVYVRTGREDWALWAAAVALAAGCVAALPRPRKPAPEAAPSPEAPPDQPSAA